MAWTVYYEATWRAKLTASSCQVLAEHARAVNRTLSEGSEPYRIAVQPGDKACTCFTKLCGADPSRDFRTILVALQKLTCLAGKARVVVSDDHYLDGADPNRIDPDRVESDAQKEPLRNDQHAAARLLVGFSVPDKALPLPVEPKDVAAYAKLVVRAAEAAGDLETKSMPGSVDTGIMKVVERLYERHRGWQKKLPADAAALRDCVGLLCALERAGRAFAVKYRDLAADDIAVLYEMDVPSLARLVQASAKVDAFRAEHGIAPKQGRRAT